MSYLLLTFSLRLPEHLNFTTSRGLPVIFVLLAGFFPLFLDFSFRFLFNTELPESAYLRFSQLDSVFLIIPVLPLKFAMMSDLVHIHLKFLCSDLLVLFPAMNTFSKGRRNRRIKYSYPTSGTHCSLNSIQRR